MSELDEHQGMDEVVNRLAQRFPTLTLDRIHLVVDEELHRLENGRIRDFVPVLVEHAATERLRKEADPVAATVDDPAAGAIVADDPLELDPMEVERKAREARSGFLFGDLGGGPS